MFTYFTYAAPELRSCVKVERQRQRDRQIDRARKFPGIEFQPHDCRFFVGRAQKPRSFTHCVSARFPTAPIYTHSTKRTCYPPTRLAAALRLLRYCRFKAGVSDGGIAFDLYLTLRVTAARRPYFTTNNSGGCGVGIICFHCPLSI